MSNDMDYASPAAQFKFDMNNSTLFKKDNQNLINILGVKQLNTLENTSLLDIYLSKGNVVEPHYHQNAAEIVYGISGAATVSMLNPIRNNISTIPSLRARSLTSLKGGGTTKSQMQTTPTFSLYLMHKHRK